MVRQTATGWPIVIEGDRGSDIQLPGSDPDIFVGAIGGLEIRPFCHGGSCDASRGQLKVPHIRVPLYKGVGEYLSTCSRIGYQPGPKQSTTGRLASREVIGSAQRLVFSVPEMHEEL